jgi:hypothetical protein
MKFVRVLDLEDTKGIKDDDLEHIGKLLPLLKFLSLRGCQEITHLPNSLGALRQLQTLDVRDSSIVILPQPVIVMLRKLQYVRAGTKNPTWDEGGIMVTCQPQTTELVEEVIEAAAAPVAATQDAAKASMVQAQDATRTSTGAPRNMPDASLPTWLSKMCCMNNVGDDHIKGCVKVPFVIGSLTAIHTFGVINVGPGKKILKELNRLTQLKRLGVCCINVDNIHMFFYAITALSHLESLTVRVQPVKNKGQNKNKQDHFFACLDDNTSPPPKALKILKLHGRVRILSANWMKQLGNLEKLDLEMIVLDQKEINTLGALPNQKVLLRLCVRPIHITELYVSARRRSHFIHLEALEIDCTSELKVVFEEQTIAYGIKVLKVCCSSESPIHNFLICTIYVSSRRCGLKVPTLMKSSKICSSNLRSISANLF